MKYNNQMQHKPQSYIFVGRSGCGKGTQAEQLEKTLKAKDPANKVLHVITGDELRKIKKDGTFTGNLTGNTIDNGGFMPVFMTVHSWSNVLAKSFDGTQNLLFDGTPRKVTEAQVLDSVFPFYGLDKPWIIYLDVDHDESTRRLKLRGRNDDTDEAMAKRMEWYEREVVPVVEYYRSNPDVNFLDINGQQTIEAVHADIVKMVGLS